MQGENLDLSKDDFKVDGLRTKLCNEIPFFDKRDVL